FVPPSMVHPEAGPALDDFLFHALDPDPNARFGSIDEMRRALHSIVSEVHGVDDEVGIEIDVAESMDDPGHAAASPFVDPDDALDAKTPMVAEAVSVAPPTPAHVSPFGTPPPPAPGPTVA